MSCPNITQSCDKTNHFAVNFNKYSDCAFKCKNNNRSDIESRPGACDNYMRSQCDKYDGLKQSKIPDKCKCLAFSNKLSELYPECIFPLCSDNQKAYLTNNQYNTKKI